MDQQTIKERILLVLDETHPEWSEAEREACANDLSGRRWTLTDVAAVYDVRYKAAWSWCHKGQMRCTKIGGRISVRPQDALSLLRVGPGRPRVISNATVRRIRELALTQEQSVIAEQFGISPALVSRIVSRERYGDVA